MRPALLVSALILTLSMASWAESPACISNGGSTACGYHCVSNYGQVACARTPAGACAANYGQLTCWDPQGPARVTRHWPAAECLSNYGTTECGYSCVANYGQIRCAKTPAGACTAAWGTLTCWDPPPTTRYSGEYIRRAECLSRYGTTVCGYGCVANYGQIRCAATPAGQCFAMNGTLQCTDDSASPARCIH